MYNDIWQSINRHNGAHHIWKCFDTFKDVQLLCMRLTDFLLSVKYSSIFYLKFVLTLLTMVGLSSPQSQYYICFLNAKFCCFGLVLATICLPVWVLNYYSVRLCMYSYIFFILFLYRFGPSLPLIYYVFI